MSNLDADFKRQVEGVVVEYLNRLHPTPEPPEERRPGQLTEITIRVGSAADIVTVRGGDDDPDPKCCKTMEVELGAEDRERLQRVSAKMNRSPEALKEHLQFEAEIALVAEIRGKMSELLKTLDEI